MKGIREFGRKAAREPGRRNITAYQVEEAGKRRRSGFFGRFWIVILTVVLAVGLLPVPGQGGRVYAQDQPELTAKGAVVYCENTDEIVFAKGKNDKLFPYSITKLMTAMLAVQNAPLDQKVTVSREAASQKDTSMGLKEGEQVTVEQLLYGALILSGNDAAYALGEAVSGTGKMKDFVAMSLSSCFAMAGMKVELSGSYGGWDPNADSEILSLLKSEYKEMFGRDALVQVDHAGLECSVILGKYPNLDVVSLGPTLCSPHTTSERCNIPSVAEFYKFIRKVIEDIPAK